MSLLDVEDIGVRFGGVVALDGLSFSIDAGQICALIGPNGAGKTTMFNVVSPHLRAEPGHRSPSTVTTCWRCRRTRSSRSGVARTFQNLALVPGAVACSRT